MKQKDKFRYAEKCLYGYKQHMACLKVLREDLRVEQAGTDVHAQNYQYTFGFNGEPSNPVEARQIKIESLQARIRILERYTEPITALIESLTGENVLNGSNNAALMDILRLMYFGRNTPDAIMEELNIARRTFARRRRELVYTTIVYLGL